VVIGDPVTLKMLAPGTDIATEVTVPAPVGVAQVPSPRQNVDDEADVPLLRFVTERFPVTSVAKLTAPNVGAPAALPCKTVIFVPSDARTAGANPAPPPSTIRLAVSAAEEDMADADEK
jgi:hypothetical protein